MAGTSSARARAYCALQYCGVLGALAAFSSLQYMAEVAVDGERVPVERALQGGLLFWGAWGVVFPVLDYGAGRIGEGAASARVGVLRAVSACVLAAASQIVVRRAISLATGWEPERTVRELLASHFLLNVACATFVLVALVVWRGKQRLAQQVRDAEREQRRVRELENTLARMELEALRNRLEPHFLLNTLQGIAALIHTDPAQAECMLVRTGTMLREVVASGGEEQVTLERELAFVEGYLILEQMRYGERLRFRVEAEPDVMHAGVPPFFLQPLVENAVRHGIAPRARGGLVHIAVWREGAELVARVTDDGMGLSQTGSPPLGTGVGIALTRARLERRYGTAHQFIIQAGAHGGTVVRVRVPYEPVLKRAP